MMETDKQSLHLLHNPQQELWHWNYRANDEELTDLDQPRQGRGSYSSRIFTQQLPHHRSSTIRLLIHSKLNSVTECMPTHARPWRANAPVFVQPSKREEPTREVRNVPRDTWRWPECEAQEGQIWERPGARGSLPVRAKHPAGQRCDWVDRVWSREDLYTHLNVVSHGSSNAFIFRICVMWTIVKCTAQSRWVSSNDFKPSRHLSSELSCQY